MSLRNGDSWLVVGSAMGAPRDPAGVVNLRANPDVTIEAVVGDDIATIPVHATELEGEDREAAFRRFVKVVPAFQAYQAQYGRRLPVMRLTPRR